MYESDPSTFMGPELPQDWQAPSTSSSSTETGSSFSSSGTGSESAYSSDRYTSTESASASGQTADFYNPIEPSFDSGYSSQSGIEPVEVASASGRSYLSPETSQAADPFYAYEKWQDPSTGPSLTRPRQDTEGDISARMFYGSLNPYETRVTDPNISLYEVPKNNNSLTGTLYRSVGADTSAERQALFNDAQKAAGGELNSAWFTRDCGGARIATEKNADRYKVTIAKNPDLKNQGSYLFQFETDLKDVTPTARASSRPAATATPTPYPESTTTARPEATATTRTETTATPVPEATSSQEQSTSIPEATPTPSNESTVTPTPEMTPTPEETPSPTGTPEPESIISQEPKPVPKPTPSEITQRSDLEGDLNREFDKANMDQGTLEPEPQGPAPEHIESGKAHEILAPERAESLMTRLVAEKMKASGRSDYKSSEDWSRAMIKEMQANNFDLTPSNIALVEHQIERESSFEKEPSCGSVVGMKNRLQKAIRAGEYDKFKEGPFEINIPPEKRDDYCQFIEDTAIKYGFVKSQKAEDGKIEVLKDKKGFQISADSTEKQLTDRIDKNLASIISDARAQKLDSAVAVNLFGEGLVNSALNNTLDFGKDLVPDSYIADKARSHIQLRTHGPMQVDLSKAREFAKQEGRYTNDPDLVKELNTIDGGVHYGMKMLHAAAEPYLSRTDMTSVEKMKMIAADYNAGAWSSRNAEIQKCLNDLVGNKLTEPLKLDGDLLNYRGGEAAASLTEVATQQFARDFSLPYSDDEIRDMLLREKESSFEDTPIWADIRNAALRQYHEIDPNFYLPYATIPVDARSDNATTRLKLGTPGEGRGVWGAEGYSSGSAAAVKSRTDTLLRYMRQLGW